MADEMFDKDDRQLFSSRGFAIFALFALKSCFSRPWNYHDQNISHRRHRG